MQVSLQYTIPWTHHEPVIDGRCQRCGQSIPHVVDGHAYEKQGRWLLFSNPNLRAMACEQP